MTTDDLRGGGGSIAAAAVLTLILFYAPLAAAQVSPAMTRFNTDAKTLSTTLTTLLVAAQTLDGKIVYVQGKLDIPGKISSDLKKLDDSLSTAKVLLDAASVVPEIKTEADTMLDGIAATQGPVRDAQKTADDFDTQIKPATDSVNALEANVHKLFTDIQSLQQGLSTYIAKMAAAQQCIDGLQGSRKTSAQADLDRLATASDQKMVQLNNALQATLTRINGIGQSIETQLYPLFGPVNDVEAAIASLDTNLQNMEDPLKEVGKIMSSKFGVSFPYPDPSWSHPFRWSHYTVRIRMSTIIGGVEKIENEIESVLSKGLYKAAKFFGLEKLITSVMNDAKKSMNEVLAKLHLEFKVSVPGLDGFGGNLNSISSRMQSLVPQMGMDIGPLESQMTTFENDFSSPAELKVCGDPAPAGQSQAPRLPLGTFPYPSRLYPHAPVGPLGPMGPLGPRLPPGPIWPSSPEDPMRLFRGNFRAR